MSKSDALVAEQKFRTSVEEAQEYIESFDILETINNVGNDEVFTPVKVCQQILNILPNEVWSNPDYKWLNPSDKNGVFHREIALRLNEGLKEWEPNEEKRKKHILQKMLFSIGLTKFTAQVSRRTLYYCSDANRSFDNLTDSKGYAINGYAIGNGSWFNSPEGNLKTPTTTHKFVSGRCKFCGTREKNSDGTPGRYSDPKQLEHYAYEFIHIEDIDKHLQKRFFGGQKMKFDIIIGNPPYQLSDGGAQASARPLYNLFVEQAIKLKPKYLTMIIPMRWTLGGKGLDDFRKAMLNDKSIRIIHDYIDSKELFPQNDIKGGVGYFLWDRDKKGTCNIVTHENGQIVSSAHRHLIEKDIGVFIRRNETIDIIKKIHDKKMLKFSKIVSTRKPFDFPTNFRSYESKHRDGLIKIYAQKDVGYISRTKIKKNKDWIDKYKVLIPVAIGKGDVKTDVLKPILAEKGTCCTETYLVIGPFDSPEKAENVISYMKTKFFHFLLSVKKITQHTTARVYDLIPMQDFSVNWTDDKLFAKYSLTKDEIAVINQLVFEGLEYDEIA